MSESRHRTVPPFGRLHLITDTMVQNRLSHAELAERAIAGGADTIQYRSKESDFRVLMEEAGSTMEVCRRHGVLFLVNDRVDLALAIGADGVHLGQRDMPLEIARAILGPARVIGGTIRDRADLRYAVSAGADYVGLGPVFGTTTKLVGHPPLGLELVADVARDSPIPIVAIAGITLGNVDDVLATGVFGVAVIGAIAAAEDATVAAKAFSERIWPGRPPL